MESIQIADKTIGAGHPCFIIAEAGLNHNGDPALAERLIEKAAESGSDAVKFQTYKTAELFPPEHPDYEKFKQTEFSVPVYRSLSAKAKENGILFLSTPFDEESADLLDELDVPAYKIGSGEVTHLSFLKHVAQKKRPVILSTGMSSLLQIKAAVDTLTNNGCKQLTLLHCVSSYPCPLEKANIRMVGVLKDQFSFPAGYSDHTTCDTAPLAAVALGAAVIEKHFTLSRHLPGWDHFFSYEPDDLKRLVQSIRNVESALGSAEKMLQEIEEPIHQIARRSLYARVDLKVGQTVTKEKILVRRPVGPMTADQIDLVIGKKAIRNIPAETALKPGDFE